MMRSLWSAASGMIAQQQNVDTIANNISNVNTAGYKTEKVEFKSLLYQTLQTRTTTANGEQKPIPAQVGLGTRTASITTSFEQGAFLATDNDFGFAIDGPGFFAVRGADGGTYYTRNGNFGIAMGADGLMLTNSDGLPVLDVDGNAIVFPADVTASEIVATNEGEFYLTDQDGNMFDLNIKIGMYQFNNAAGLDKLAGSLYEITDASGPAINEAYSEGIIKSSVKQGYLEGSNVQVAEEMVNLIIAQRAYELNSKAIQASDTMLEQANNLRR